MTNVLTWVDAVNPKGTTYNVYRAVDAPPYTYAEIASGLTALTYSEAIPDGSYVYYVKAMYAGSESGASNGAYAAVAVAPPTSLAITVT